MNASKNWGFRFGLRTLFLLTALAAIAVQLRPVARTTPLDIRIGMSQAQVRSLCGEPKFAFGGSRAAIWHYFNENIYQVFFDESGKVEMMDETLVTPGGCGVGVQILP